MNMRLTFHHFVTLFLLAFASGCINTTPVGTLGRMKSDPLAGPKGQPEFWGEAGELQSSAPLHATGMRGWAIPLQLSVRNAALGHDGKDYAAHRFAWNDFGIPILLQIPIRIGWKNEYYLKGEQKPSGRNWAQWTPLWATSHDSGERLSESFPNFRVRADGVPIIASRLAVDTPESGGIRWYSMLWSFGPQVLHLKGKEARGFVAFPAMLSGVFGPILWTSAQVSLEESKIASHGPGLGLLGYAFNAHPVTIKPGEKKLLLNPPKDESEIAGRRRHRLVLGGLLWRDDSVTVLEDGKTWRSQHGVFWGLVGWGHRDGGRLRVRFFGLG